jgi:hypothetical protein
VSLRLRDDGRVLCAAMHPAEIDDRYVDDGGHYLLSVELGVLVTEPMLPNPEDPGLGGHGAHGEWWWRGHEPDEAVLEEWDGQAEA